MMNKMPSGKDDPIAQPSPPATRVPNAVGTPLANTVKVESPATGWERIFWIVVCIVCAIWIFMPNFPLVPIPFFIDEGLAGLLLLTGLAKLGIRIPVLDWFFRRRMGKDLAHPPSKD
jgi:hypothetical protein